MTNITQFIGDKLINWGNPNLDSVLNSKVGTAIDFFVGFSALVAVIILVASGYMFITAAGDPEKIEKGQKGITAAIIGLIIVFLARTIIDFVIGKILGL